MLWCELSAADFSDSIKKSGSLCILPIGVLEKHGTHLPVGTDMFIVNAIAKRAAERSEAVVFPYYFLGQIAEARHVQGTISASHRLIMDALLEMCDEIHRNGFTKILLMNGHGGNSHFLPFFAQQFPGLNRNYGVYTYFSHNMSDDQLMKVQEKSREMNMGEHAGFLETSLIMYLRPDLVNLKRQDISESKPLKRLSGIDDKDVFTGFNWYADYPHHIAGDPSRASAEYGEFIFNILCDNAVSIIDEIKADNASGDLISSYEQYTKFYPY